MKKQHKKYIPLLSIITVIISGIHFKKMFCVESDDTKYCVVKETIGDKENAKMI